jgi:extradiol dioxygenase family protein
LNDDDQGDSMLDTIDAIATVAVTDLAAAKRFYEGTLGLTPARGQSDGVVEYRTGGTKMFVYESPFAGTNKATAVTWVVANKDIDAIVRRLAGKGVAFEHYDLPGVRREGDIHVAGDLRMAWLKDPTGNILALIGG